MAYFMILNIEGDLCDNVFLKKAEVKGLAFEFL